MRVTARRLSLLFVAGALTLVAPVAQAQQDQPEAAALRFARAHHPELADLLDRLKKNDRASYEKAVRDVSQASERLAKLQENDAQRYEFALKTWTLDSRIRLLAARSTMSDDPSIEERLRELLRERQQVRLEMFRFERERLLTRLQRLDDQISQIESDPDAAIENELARIKRSMKSSANRRRRAAADGKSKATVEQKSASESRKKEDKPKGKGKD